MGQLITMFTRNIEKANSIVFIDMSLAMLRVNETISVLQESQNYLEENSWVINSPANLSAVIQNLIDARFDLGRISSHQLQAQNENNLYNATQEDTGGAQEDRGRKYLYRLPVPPPCPHGRRPDLD